MSEAAQIERELRQLDFFRRSPRWMNAFGFHKEWQHFVVHAGTLDLLVNFSICDDTRGGAPSDAELARIVVLARDRERDISDGDVESFSAADSHVPGGRLTAALGARNRLEFVDGAFRIQVELRDRPVSVDLVLRPVTRPALVHNIAMLEGPPLHWLVTPRLLASGTATVAGRTHRLDREPAYHDHNWGPFRWGHDISWEWGFALPPDPECPWTLTFVRLTNRARTNALDQALLLWKRERLVRRFRQTAVEMTADPLPLRPRSICKVPAVMALLAPELATDVPRRTHAVAREGEDWIECNCVCRDVAQVLIPSETGLGVTIFNEVSAASAVSGRIEGEEVCFEGRTTLEFIRECPPLC